MVFFWKGILKFLKTYGPNILALESGLSGCRFLVLEVRLRSYPTSSTSPTFWVAARLLADLLNFLNILEHVFQCFSLNHGSNDLERLINYSHIGGDILILTSRLLIDESS